MSRIARGICEITLETSDLDRLERFYREALGCDLLSRQAERVWLACGTSAQLGIWSPGEKEFGDRGGRHVHFALSVAPGALNRLCEQLHDLDIVHRGPIEHPGGDRSLHLEDPAGNVVEVSDFVVHGDGARRGICAFT